MDYYFIILVKIFLIFLIFLFLINSFSISNKQKLKELAEKAYQDGFYNISFNCYIQTNDLENCLKVLLESNQIPEACLFCRTYLPSKLTETMEHWNNYLNDNNTNNRISKVFYFYINSNIIFLYLTFRCKNNKSFRKFGKF
jgi:hypothetical protein